MILNRALMREVLQTSGAVTLVMLSIFMVVRLVGFLRQAADGDIPVDSLMELLLLKLVTYMDVILPLMLFVSILMVFNRWNRDNEMTVIAASGIGIPQFLRPMTILMVIMVLLVGSFSLYLSPLAVRVSESIQHEYDNRSEVSGIAPGVFTETRGGEGVYFIERFDGSEDRYKNVFAYSVSAGREGVVIAKSGFKQTDENTNDQFLVLKNGTRFEGNPGDPDYTVVEFESYAIRLKQRAQKEIAFPVAGIPTLELSDGKHHRLVSEQHWRLAKPFAIPVLILFAMALSNVDARQSRVTNMLIAFLIYFAYTNLLGLAVAMMNSGKLNPHAGLWAVHAMFLIMAMYLFLRRARNKTLLPRIWPRIRALLPESVAT